MKHWFTALSTGRQYLLVIGLLGAVIVLTAAAGGGLSSETKTVTDRSASQAALRQARTQIAREEQAAQKRLDDINDRLTRARSDVRSQKRTLTETRASARREEKRLRRLTTQTSTASAEVARNSFDGEGTYEVGSDISPGTYRASSTENCYWARLSSLDTSDIIDNNNSSGPVIVQVQASDKAFMVSGCATFHKVG